jgi:hypothetical protein
VSSSEPIVYDGWKPEKNGVIGSLSMAGCILVCSAGLLILLPFWAHHFSDEVISLPIGVVLLALAYGRVLGMTAEQWLILSARHNINVLGRRDMFLSGVFAPRKRTDDAAQPTDLPGVLARLRILSAPSSGGQQIGVIYDPLEGTYAAVLELRYPGLAMQEQGLVNRRVGAWGAFLKSQCIEDGFITRVAVHERSLPDDGTALQSWVHANLDPTAPAASLEVVQELTARGGPVAAARSSYLTVTLSSSRARLAIKGAGGGQLGACAVLVRELSAMQHSLAAADLQVVRQLNPRQLAAVIRTAYDPHAIPELAAREAAAASPDWEGVEPGVDLDLAGPAAAQAGWGVYQHDGAWSVTYQVRGWPASGVYATVLQPLLRPRETARRSMSLIYEPLGPRRARAELSRDRTVQESRTMLRQKTGRRASMDDQLAQSKADRQDAARAIGHGVVRFTAMITVTVTDLRELEAACAELQQDSAAAGLEARRLWGAQDAGFAVAALPLGQGLPARRTVI